jgi:pimeloyl-ACP methyl ester carboxylesterase
MKARQPDQSGYAVNDGVRIYYEVHGNAPTTLLLLPTWSIIDSQCWKMQVHFLARHYRVVTYDPRGNGHSDRPVDTSAYTPASFSGDLRAVLDASETAAAVLVVFCFGTK